MGRALSGAVVAPYAEREIVGLQPTDHDLVAAVRRGEDRAFEQLFERYQRRIAAYVLGMVHDHGRAEDITQEIFISALRRMRETERPIAFKPWIYEIAKNACIDQFRRSKRTEEVSYDAEEGLGAADYGRLAQRGPSPDAAVDQKQALHDLCGAFGGLSETHHQILVLRELEGLSYREIGDRLGMSRPSVESTLFRARRRLTEEYDELASGQRCIRVQALIGTAAEGLLGSRDSRRLARHLSHCQPCRKQARSAGVDAGVMARRPGRREALGAKIAGLLPFPAFLRGRRSTEPESVLAAGQGHTLVAQWSTAIGTMPEPIVAGWGKAAAAAATLVLAGVGAGAAERVSQAPAGSGERAAPSGQRIDGPRSAARSGASQATPAAGAVRARNGRIVADRGLPAAPVAPKSRPADDAKSPSGSAAPGSPSPTGDAPAGGAPAGEGTQSAAGPVGEPDTSLLRDDSAGTPREDPSAPPAPVTLPFTVPGGGAEAEGGAPPAAPDRELPEDVSGAAGELAGAATGALAGR